MEATGVLMRPLPRWSNLGLRTKLALLIEGVILAMGLATALLVTFHVRGTLEAELAKRGLAIAADLAAFSVRPLLANDLATLRRFVNHSMGQDHVRYAAVLDPDGRVVMHSDLTELGRQPKDPLTMVAIKSAAPGVDTTSMAQRDEPLYGIYVPITAADTRLGTVVLGYSRAAIQEAIAHAGREIAWISLLAAVVAGLLAFLLSDYISRPIITIASAMQRASEGEIKGVLSVRRGDEIGVLATSFNTMAEDLTRHRKRLSQLVEVRTAALRDANVRLEVEIAERSRIEDELRRSRQELRDLASHLQSVREQERTDIAREIHDELGQALTALKLDLHWVGQRVGDGQEPVGAKIRAMSRIVDGTVQMVRRISSQLRPKLLDDLGLSAAMEWEARQFEQRTGVTCRIRSEPDDIVVDQARSTALFRIFQETLTNIARHAAATKVDVLLRNFAGTVEMTVTDDGKGIRPEQVSDGRSLGIVGMRERVRSLGGEVEFNGRRGVGTTVHVSLPGAAEREAR